jgi:hypothetical protein
MCSACRRPISLIDLQGDPFRPAPAVSVEQVTGTWSGSFVDPATGKVTPGNGRKFDHPGVMGLEYAPDHRIRHVSIYWDRLIVDRQLGIAPK